MESADHGETERALAVHHLGNLAFALQVRLQIDGLKTGLIHAKADRFDWVGSGDGELGFLVFLDWQGPQPQFAFVGRRFNHHGFDVRERGLMLAGGFDHFGFHDRSDLIGGGVNLVIFGVSSDETDECKSGEKVASSGETPSRRLYMAGVGLDDWLSRNLTRLLAWGVVESKCPSMLKRLVFRG